MGYSVFYSFHYEDVGNFKANIIRNSSKIKCFQGLLTDKSVWEEFKAKSDYHIKKRIDKSELVNSDVTVVLIGQNTYSRRWVKYEIIKSIQAGNAIIGIHINRIKGKEGKITPKGKNPFERLAFEYDQEKNTLFFYELIDRKWKPFKDLPWIENEKDNSIFVKRPSFFQSLLGKSKDGNFYKLSDFFEQYVWEIKKGNSTNAADLYQWIENSYQSFIV